MAGPTHPKIATNTLRDYAWIVVPVICVLAIYVWFISAGTWTSWSPTAIYDYYSNLASAFQHGNLFLDDKPSPELLALPDPYRLGLRRDIPYIWDASLYRGHYYLYWGPVPALIILPLKLVFPAFQVGDNYLVFLFVCGMYLTLCFLITRIWRRFYPNYPRWLLLLALLLVGLVIPLPWMLNRPEVYEAAIAAGQFFFLLGIYFAFSGLDAAQTSARKVVLASLFWGLAIGSRTSKAIPIAFLLLAAAAWMLANRGRLRLAGHWPAMLAALLLPTAAIMLALGWYNWARFGSVAEFGYRYQLTLLQLPKHYTEIFSTSYVLPNLHNYFLNPFTWGKSFPFIKPQYGRSVFGLQYGVPRIYFSEAVTGLVFTFPFAALAVVPTIAWVIRRPVAVGMPGSADADRIAWTRLTGWLVGVAALELISLLVFFFATMRYLADLVPLLSLLSIVGMWEAYGAAAPRPSARVVVSVLSLSLAVLTMLVSTLLSISSYQDRFATVNPALLDQFNRFFGR